MAMNLYRNDPILFQKYYQGNRQLKDHGLTNQYCSKSVTLDQDIRGCRQS